MKKNFQAVITMSLLLLTGVIVGCGDDDDDNNMSTLSLSFSGLEDLGSDYMYEGWLLVDGNPVSTGTFSVNGNGALSQSDFEVSDENIVAATKFILTIEPYPDSDPAPAETHYLAGDFSSDMADLTVGDAAALGNDFSTAAGTYILNTPSSATEDDYHAGIWWLIPENGMSASLTLPTLPTGWVYEGWVVVDGSPISTGTFTSVSGDDSDMGGPTAGPLATPPFPGQDFVNPLVSLIGGAAVVSIEPSPDNSSTPFALKPLLDGNIEELGIGVGQSMTNNASSFATGTATR